MSSSSNDRDPINTPAKYKEILNCLVDEIWHPPSPNDKTARTEWRNRQQTRLVSYATAVLLSDEVGNLNNV